MNRVAIFFLSLFTLLSCQNDLRPETRVLVFSRTTQYTFSNGTYRHASIPDGIAAIQQLGEQYGFIVDTTEDARNFNEANLRRYSAVIFLNTVGNVLNLAQQADFERYIQAGGGFVGIHSATDTEHGWPWYGKMVGAYFESHPDIQEADLKVINPEHPATTFLPGVWTRTDEWYNFKPGSFNESVNVLLEIDESSYEGGKMGDFHPMAWYHEYDGGRAFYTELGHRPETFQEELFLKHLYGGIRYAVGENRLPDYAKAHTPRVPEEDRFSRIVLDEVFDEPMELEVLENGDVLLVERKGAIKKYYAAQKVTREIAHLEVHTGHEDGLLGLALDPDFPQNPWIYLFYSPPGEEPVQHVSRFTLTGDSLDFSSEKVLLKIPVQRDECCHSAGSLEFDHQGNLFISVGDNTNPFHSDGYGPIDDRPGRKPFDARRSSANTMDLRGKILRIHPETDGTYSIPDGNLFPKDGKEGRPEIYVMGCRNPFRHSYDPKTGYLYWGDVGPDAAKDSAGRGPRGHDEVNQARQPGFFGWPLFVGDNKPYNDYDFATQTSGPLFDPEQPANQSAFNTGAELLPPAQKAFIWYPYARSKEFAMLRSGSRNAMAGPFYYSGNYDFYPTSFPAYYDGKVLIYDWMRGWLFYVTLKENGDLAYLEPFLPSHKFNNPIDMQFGPDGALYVLEYGTGWFLKNPDARISRIEYHRGNRPPVAMLEADKSNGPVPLTVQFSAAQSKDHDGDSLRYKWWFDGAGAQSLEKNPQYTFERPGIYEVMLRVRDAHGATHDARMEIQAGNTAPVITWQIEGNRSFYWPGKPVSYAVRVNDAEDGETGKGISPEAVAVSIDYLAETQDLTVVALGHQTKASAQTAEQLIEVANCRACHGLGRETLAGPGYLAVAEKYGNMPGAMKYLSGKILKGGGGVWGEQMMPAQVQLSEAEASRIARYILALGKEKESPRLLPSAGSFTPKVGDNGIYYLQATYSDRGGKGLGPLTTQEAIALRPARLEAETYDASSYVIDRGGDKGTWVDELVEGSFLMYSQIDLTGIQGIRYFCRESGQGRIELRLDRADGPVVSVAPLRPSRKPQAFIADIEATQGLHDLYLVFHNDGEPDDKVAVLDWVEVEGKM